MAFDLLKLLLPKRPMPTRIWRGPFRGACIVMNPRDSLRKILGVYEHELNPWLEQALRRVTRVLDVGANDGYFTFGCAAAFQRLGKAGEIVAFEPQDQHILKLRESLKDLNGNQTRIYSDPEVRRSNRSVRIPRHWRRYSGRRAIQMTAGRRW